MSRYFTAAFAAACLITSPAARAGGPAAVDAFGDALPAGAIARLGSSRLRHGCTVLAWAPDGKTFASAGHDKTIRVWDASDGRRLREFKPSDDWSYLLLFDPEGKRLLAAGLGGVQVLDATTGAEVHALRRPPGQSIAALAWRPGGTVAMLDRAGAYRIWDPKKDRISGESGLPTAPATFRCVGLSPDGGLYAVWDKDRDLLTVRDADGKEWIHAPPGFPGVGALAFSADGKTLAVCGPSGQVALWDVDAGKESWRIEGVLIGGQPPALSPNGKYLVGRGGQGAVGIHVWGAASGKTLRQFDPVGFPIGGWGKPAALSPDGKRLIAAQGQAIHVWDVETGAETPGFVGHNGSVDGICFSAGGRDVFTRGQDGVVGRWDAATGKRLAWHTLLENVVLLPAPTADGRIGVCGLPGAFARWGPGDVDSEEAPAFTGVELPSPNVATSADGKTAAARGDAAASAPARGPDPFVHIWDVDTGKERAKVKLERPIVSTFALAPDGRMLAVGTPFAATRLYDAATGAEVRSLDAAPGRPGAQGATILAFTPDGRMVFSALGKDMCVWETASGGLRLRAAWPGTPDAIVRFSQDGRLLAFTTPTGSAAILDATDGRQAAEFPCDLGRVRSLAFARDGAALAAGGADGTALVWDIKEYSKRRSPAELPAARLPALWDDLLDGDAGRAYKAVLALAASPKAAAPFLRERAAAPAPDQRPILRLIKDLEDLDFDVREGAQRGLESRGLAALPAVRQALDAGPPAESRRRLQEVLDKHGGIVPVTEGVRALRAVEALETSGAAEALAALRALAVDADDAEVKRAAAASLDRLARRAPAP